MDYIFFYSLEAKLEEGEIDSEGDGHKKEGAAVTAGKS